MLSHRRPVGITVFDISIVESSSIDSSDIENLIPFYFFTHPAAALEAFVWDAKSTVNICSWEIFARTTQHSMLETSQ